MKLALALLLLSFTFPSFALQSRDLIRDAESLYNQLGPRAPERRGVALRLADLCFEGAVEIDADTKSTPKDAKLADQYRRRAFQLYSESLPSLTGLNAVRVRFQLSRLHVYAARIDSAIALWKGLIQQNLDKRIRRESALHLAEQYEMSNRRELVLEAVKMYDVAMPLAETEDLRGYIHFRTAWTRFRLGQGDLAIAQMRKSLELSAKNEKVSRLKDLTLFLSRAELSAAEAMKILRDYEGDLRGVDLLPKLAEAYMAADRRDDYAFVIQKLNERAPTLDRTVAILDTRHDQLKPAEIQDTLESLIDLKLKGGRFSDQGAEIKARDTLFRFVIIWDGQQKAGKAAYKPVFASGVNVMVHLFPRSEEAEKSVGSWLKSQTELKDRQERLEDWIPLVKNPKDSKFELALRRELIETARQLKNWNQVIAETQKLEPLVPVTERRALRYQRAKAHHEKQNHAAALPLFIEVANAPGAPDQLTKFSQDLALNIVGENKDYAEAIRLSERWKSARPDLAVTAEKARFERAARDQDAPALAEFTKFCVNRKFHPKSCENAETLARALEDRPTLLTLLRVQGKEEDLARELELGARFTESARLLEKRLKKDSPLVDTLKIALLYELEGNLAERNRILKALKTALPARVAKISEPEQTLVYQTLRDAGLVEDALVKWTWAPAVKTAIANDVLSLTPAAPVSSQLLISSCENAGAHWERLHLARLAKSYKELSAIDFFGRGSEAKFQKRAQALKDFSQKSDCFAKTAPVQLRYATLGKVAQAYEEFSAQIRSAPIPEGIDEETRKEVEQKIDSVAAPFDELAGNWKSASEDAGAQLAAAERIDVAKWNFTPITEPAPKPRALAFDWRRELESLRKNPEDRATLEQLKTHFEEKGSPRLAAYIRGRLDGLEEQ